MEYSVICIVIGVFVLLCLYRFICGPKAFVSFGRDRNANVTNGDKQNEAQCHYDGDVEDTLDDCNEDSLEIPVFESEASWKFVFDEEDEKVQTVPMKEVKVINVGDGIHGLLDSQSVNGNIGKLNKTKLKLQNIRSDPIPYGRKYAFV